MSTYNYTSREMIPNRAIIARLPDFQHLSFTDSSTELTEILDG